MTPEARKLLVGVPWGTPVWSTPAGLVVGERAPCAIYEGGCACARTDRRPVVPCTEGPCPGEKGVTRRGVKK